MTESTITEPRTDPQIRAAVFALIVEMAPSSAGEPGTATAEPVTAAGEEAAVTVEPGPDSRLVEDLGYHSLALLELAFALEDEFDLEPIDEETARTITTVVLVQDTVIKRVHERETAG